MAGGVTAGYRGKRRLGRNLAVGLIALGLFLVAGSIADIARASLGTLSFTIVSPAAGETIDFGTVIPDVPATLQSAVTFDIASDLDWRLAASATTLSGSFVLEESPHDANTWVAIGTDPANPSLLRPAEAPTETLTSFTDDLRVTAGWDLAPGTYTVTITYVCSFTDTTPPTVDDFAINGEADATNSTEAALSFAASDGGTPPSEVEGVCFTNGDPSDPDVWSDWYTYNPGDPTAHWDLLPGDGVKTVWVKARDYAGNESAPVSDMIILDTVPPVISRILVSNVTATTADVSWNTTEGASSQVEYGLTTAYGQSSALVPGPLTSHLVTVTGLTPGVTNHLRPLSADPAGNVGYGDDQLVLTRCAPPVLSVTRSTQGWRVYANLSWTAQAGATAYNIYQRDVQAGETGFTLLAPPSPTASTTYRIQMPTSAFAYEWYVTALNAAGESVASNVVAVIGDNLPPVISEVTAEPGQVDCVITWTTNEPATSQVRYGTSSGSYPNQTTIDANLVTSHSVTVSGLSAGTLYYFVVRSADMSGAQATSTEYYFTTLAATRPDPPPNFAVDLKGQPTKLEFSWDPAPMAEGYRLYRRDVVTGTTVLLKDTTGTSYSDVPLHPPYVYEYWVTAYNHAEDGTLRESDPSTVITVTASTGT